MAEYVHPASLIPENDEERLRKLYSYEILDTPAEATFEKIAQLAAQIFGTPVAQINFVDKERVFFKSNISPLEAVEINRADSFCSRAILQPNVTVFEDLHEVPALADNKFVAENGVRFYAGAPLKTREGFQIGTVCVLDLAPKTVTQAQIKMLESLSSIVMDELELRAATRKAVRIQTDFFNRVVHDLKNPNTTILLSAELIQLKTNDPTTVSSLAGRIHNAATGVLGSLNNLLDISQMEEGAYPLTIETININETLYLAANNFELIAASKGQGILLQVPANPMMVSGDAGKLLEIFENLISNALKYAHPDTEVKIVAYEEEGHAVIKVTDHGQGLTEDDMLKLFSRFVRLSAVPTGKEHSNGLGLFLVKSIAELHKGSVWATSEGKNKGASFYVRLPIAVQF